MRKLLVIIDMVNGFLKEGPAADRKINDILPNVIKLIERAKKENAVIVAFRDCHSKNEPDYMKTPERMSKWEYESQLVDELKEYEKDFDYIIKKEMVDGFSTDAFKKVAEKEVFDSVVVTGCCTDICVKCFVEEYINYAKENKLPTTFEVVCDACATFDKDFHPAKQHHTKALYDMMDIGAKIVKTENVKFCDRQEEK